MPARPFDAIPGPPSRFLVGELPAFKAALPWEVCAGYAKTYGPITRIKVLGNSIAVLNGPDEIGDVLERQKALFFKDRPRDAILPLSTDISPFISPGDAPWAERRNALPQARAGYHAWLVRRLPVMLAEMTQRCAELSKLGEFDAYEALLRMAFDVNTVVLLGRPLGDEAFQCFLDLGALGDRRLRWRLPVGSPWGRAADVLVQRWFDFFRAAVAEIRQSPADRDDVIAFQIKAGSTLSDDALAIEVANSYFGGCFSSTTGLMATLYELTQAPAEYRRLKRELEGLRGADGTLDTRAMMTNSVLDFAVREALRLRPPVAFFVRKVKPGVTAELGGYSVPPKTTLFISCYALHLSPEHWGSDALTYRPSRWEGDVAAKNPYGSGWFFPFGRGKRTCAGEQFALAFMKLGVAALVTAGIQLGVGQPFEPEIFFATMRPRGLKGRVS